MKKHLKWIIPGVLVMALIITGVLIYFQPKKEIVYTDPRDLMFVQPEIVYADEDDEDGDKLTNGEENELGTNLLAVDTDSDGIDDYTELNETKTDPLKKDTDGDKLKDGVELAMGLNPLEKKTDGKILDNKREFTKEYNVEQCTLIVEGDANVGNIYVDTVDECNISNYPGVVSELYEFYMEDQKFDKATVSFSYDKSKLDKNGLVEDDLAVYQLLNSGEFELVEGEINTENHTITVELEHFSKYFVANKEVIESKITSQVFILLDNSGSMYSKDVVSTSGENDVDFKRVDMAKQLIKMSDSGEIQFGLAKFTATYTELAGGFNNTKDALFEKLDSIKTDPEKFNGTYIASSIKSALNNFEETDTNHRKFIVLLTDGETTESGWRYDENDAIRDAVDKNVSIIIIGLGNNVDTDYLTKIANGTDGVYIHANKADVLTKIYDTINAGLNFNMVDSDGDGLNDRILLADSGFNPEENGFSFENPSIWENGKAGGGICYGMAAVTSLYYEGKLPPFALMVEDHWAGGINGGMIGSSWANIGDIEFFKNDGKTITSNTDLFEYKIHSVYEYIMNAELDEVYERSEENSTKLVFTKEIRKMIEESKCLSLKKCVFKDMHYFEKDGKPYDSLECIRFTFDVDPDELKGEDLDAYNMLKFLYNYWSRQGDYHYETLIDIGAQWEGGAHDKAFQKIIADINQGKVPMVAGEGHVINGIAIYRDIKNPREYILEVYDNNYPGETKEIKIVKEDYFALDIDINHWHNEYDYVFYDSNNTFWKGEDARVNLVFAYCQ